MLYGASSTWLQVTLQLPQLLEKFPLRHIMGQSLVQYHGTSVIARAGLSTHNGYGTSVPALLPTQTSRSILEGESVSVC